jgi:hypothetical protein
MPGHVLEKLEEVLRVQKRMWLRPSTSWRTCNARGGTAKLGERQCDVEDAWARQHKVGRAAARQGSDAWDRRKQEVALESLQR